MSDEPVAIEAGATTRRAMLAGAGAAGAAAVLAACGTDQGNDPYSAAPENEPETPSSPAGTPSTAPEGQEGQAGGLVATEEVEVGGGVIREEEGGVVITQPVAGEWRGFSATCTHQGCTVASVSDGTINCNCHGSRFSIEDGSVVEAARGVDIADQDPLPAVAVEVRDGWVVRA
jgi:Rieske Fe-S protein